LPETAHFALNEAKKLLQAGVTPVTHALLYRT
jgi:hypothetical protein